MHNQQHSNSKGVEFAKPPPLPAHTESPEIGLVLGCTVYRLRCLSHRRKPLVHLVSHNTEGIPTNGMGCAISEAAQFLRLDSRTKLPPSSSDALKSLRI